MKIIVLASGSKGNAIYIETENSKVLFDAGISFKTIKERLLRQNVVFNAFLPFIVFSFMILSPFWTSFICAKNTTLL